MPTTTTKTTPTTTTTTFYIYIYIYMWWGQIDGIGAKLPGDREATSLEALCVIY
jgi:hypothetical protein